jgi:putative salt-induced outer membrane protein
MTVRPVMLLAATGLALACPSPAPAELPPAVRAMIDAALATGDKNKVATVIELARQTNPYDAPEIDAIEAASRTALAEREKAAALAKEREIRHAGLLERWSGKGELGASQASGNTDNVGLSVALALERRGIDWSHKLRARADYQRSNGETTREQLFASYEPRYQINDGLFAYALAQYDRDRFQGFSARYAVSGGLGYHLVDRDDVDLAVKVGPAYRVVRFIDDDGEHSFAALAGLDFDWRITDRLSLTQDTNAVTDGRAQATAIIARGNTNINLVTGLEAKVSDHFGARLSYTVDYDSNPPTGTVSTDTLSRVTIVYDF